MRLRKHDRLKGIDLYFAGYDCSAKDCCVWAKHSSEAIGLSNREAIDRLIRFLYVNAGMNTEVFRLEVIDDGRKLLQKDILGQLQDIFEQFSKSIIVDFEVASKVNCME